MTGTQLAKRVHEAVTGLAAVYELALETMAAEAASLRARAEEVSKHLAQAAKERGEIAEALPPGSGSLADRVRDLAKGSLPDGYRNESSHKGSGTNLGDEAVAWVVVNENDPAKDSIVLHLSIDQAHEVRLALQARTGTCLAPFRAISSAVDGWKELGR